MCSVIYTLLSSSSLSKQRDFKVWFICNSTNSQWRKYHQLYEKSWITFASEYFNKFFKREKSRARRLCFDINVKFSYFHLSHVSRRHCQDQSRQFSLCQWLVVVDGVGVGQSVASRNQTIHGYCYVDVMRACTRLPYYIIYHTTVDLSCYHHKLGSYSLMSNSSVLFVSIFVWNGVFILVAVGWLVEWMWIWMLCFPFLCDHVKHRVKIC